MNKTTVAKGVKGSQDKRGSAPSKPPFFGQAQSPTKRVINPRGMRKK